MPKTMHRHLLFPVLVLALSCILRGALAQNFVWGGLNQNGPDTTNGPVEVRVGFFLDRFLSVNEVDGTWSANGQFTAEWYDPRLIEAVQDPVFWQEYFLPTGTNLALWTPALSVKNFLSPDQNIDYNNINAQIVDNSTGLVRWGGIFVGSLTADLDLRQFPFDSQTLPFTVASDLYPTDQVVLVRNPSVEGLSSNVKSDSWNLNTTVEFQIQTLYDEGLMGYYSYYSMTMTVYRNPAFILNKLCSIIILIIYMGFTVFLFDPSEFALRSGIGFTVFMAIVTSYLVVSILLPAVAYVTQFDIFIIVSTYTVFFIVVESAAINMIYKRGKKVRLAARKSQGLAAGYDSDQEEMQQKIRSRMFTSGIGGNKIRLGKRVISVSHAVLNRTKSVAGSMKGSGTELRHRLLNRSDTGSEFTNMSPPITPHYGDFGADIDKHVDSPRSVPASTPKRLGDFGEYFPARYPSSVIDINQDSASVANTDQSGPTMHKRLGRFERFVYRKRMPFIVDKIFAIFVILAYSTFMIIFVAGQLTI